VLGADVLAAVRFPPPSSVFLLANNFVLVIGVVGAANLWAQSGLKARDAVVLGAALAVYDFVATSVLSTTNDMVDRLALLPFAPLVAWPSGDSQWLGGGLGDLLLVTVFPLVMRKAFGRTAGVTALVLGLATLTTMLLLLDIRVVRITVPAMVVLGPLMVAQYLFWNRRRGSERTTWQYPDGRSWWSVGSGPWVAVSVNGCDPHVARRRRASISSSMNHVRPPSLEDSPRHRKLSGVMSRKLQRSLGSSSSPSRTIIPHSVLPMNRRTRPLSGSIQVERQAPMRES
jgi:hypothetical protein